MIRIPATGVFLDANDLNIVQSAVMVATRLAEAYTGGRSTDDLFENEGNARAYITTLTAFAAHLAEERNK